LQLAFENAIYGSLERLPSKEAHLCHSIQEEREMKALSLVGAWNIEQAGITPNYAEGCHEIKFRGRLQTY